MQSTDYLRDLADSSKPSLARRDAEGALLWAASEIEALRGTLMLVLASFQEPGHPGRPSHRSGWVSDEQLALWRTILEVR
jgi:hypothetical protein